MRLDSLPLHCTLSSQIELAPSENPLNIAVAPACVHDFNSTVKE